MKANTDKELQSSWRRIVILINFLNIPITQKDAFNDQRGEFNDNRLSTYRRRCEELGEKVFL